MYVKSKKTNVVYVATQKSSNESTYAPDFPEHGILPGFELQNHATEEIFWIEAWKLGRYKVLTEAEVESSYHLYLHKVAHPDTPPAFSKLIITDSEAAHEFTTTATHDYTTKEFTSIVIQFSEAVTLRPGATHTITIAGEVFGTLSQHSANSLLVTPTNQNLYNYVAGEFTFDIAGDVVQDSVGQLVPATSLTITFVDDRSVPAIETITFDGASLETGATHEFFEENMQTVTVELTEPVTLVPDAPAVITVDGTQWGTFTVDGSTLTVTPDSEAYVEGETTFVIAADTLQSAEEKANAEATITITFVDGNNIAPYAQNLIFTDYEESHVVEDGDTLTYTIGYYTSLVMNITPDPISLIGAPNTAIVKDGETPWGTFSISGSELIIIPDDGYDYPASGDIEFVIDAGVFEYEGNANEAISITITFVDDTP